MDNNIKFFALGGLDENGKNMYCFEINGEILIIEAGLKYPKTHNLGIDIEIPTFDYLIENKSRVKGILISHAHPDTMGSIVYLIKDLNIPIYASSLTSWVIEDRLKEAKINKYRINRIKENTKIKVGNSIEITTFKTTHSIIQSLGFAIQSEQGQIIFMSDFIIDLGANDEYQTDMQALVGIAKKQTLLLLTESAGALNSGYTSPNHQITNKVEPIISEASGRIIVTSYTHSMYNIKEIVDVAIKHNYRILFYNRELQDLVHKQWKIGLPIIDKSKIASFNDINKNDVLIILSGDGSDLFEQLSKIATMSDDKLKPNKKDTFIVASPAIPGVENLSIKAIDDIYRLDSDVYTFSSKNIKSMHASKEDIKFTINLFKPKYYLPIKGEYINLVANANIANEMGIDDDNIIILMNGDGIVFKDKNLLDIRYVIDTDSLLIAGQTANDSNGVVLNDRLSLSQDGTIIVGVSLDKKDRKTIIMDIQTRGFIYIKDSEYIIDNIKEIVTNIMDNFDFKKEQDFNDIKQTIREKVGKYVYKETNKRPIILSMIVTV